MDRWLKSGTFKTKRSSDCSSNQQAENININEDEPPSILKEPVKKKTKKTRKYDKKYLEFGFSWTGDETEPFHFALFVLKI